MLALKMSPGENFLGKNELNLHKNNLLMKYILYEKSRAVTRFDIEAKGICENGLLLRKNAHGVQLNQCRDVFSSLHLI